MVTLQAPSVPLNGDASASQEKVEKLAGPLLEEYLHIKVTATLNLLKIVQKCSLRVLAYY